MNELAVMMHEDEQLSEAMAASEKRDLSDAMATSLAMAASEKRDLSDAMAASLAMAASEKLDLSDAMAASEEPPNDQLVSNVGHEDEWCDGLSDDEICAVLCKATQEDGNRAPNGKKLTECGSTIDGLPLEGELLNVCFLNCVFKWLIERRRITNPVVKIFCRDLSHSDTMCPKPVIGTHPLTPAQHAWIAQVFEVSIIVHDMGNLVNENPCEPEYAQLTINERRSLPIIELALRGGHYYLLEDV